MQAARGRDIGNGVDEPVALAAYWRSNTTTLSHNAFLVQVILSKLVCAVSMCKYRAKTCRTRGNERTIYINTCTLRIR